MDKRELASSSILRMLEMNHDNIRFNEDKYQDKSHSATLSRGKIAEVGSMSEQKHDSMDNETDKAQGLNYLEKENFESETTIMDDSESYSGDNSNVDTDDYLIYQKSNIANYLVKQNEFINLSYYVENFESIINEKIGAEELNEENYDSNQMFEENGSKYYCKKCDRTFDVFKLFEKHILYRHTGFKRHQCKECDYATNNLSHLKRHIKTHAEQHITHNCSHCNFTCESSRSLKKHVYTHNNLRPYKCPFCPYASVTINHLTRHKLIHS
ncbi:zinc finger protein 528-like [Cotesia glomerata]|nr:zinc finger protein 528-like [Cotesia glomerata]